MLQNNFGDEAATDEQVWPPAEPRDAPKALQPAEAVHRAARRCGVDLDLDKLSKRPDGTAPSLDVLSEWAIEGGLDAKVVKLRWKHLIQVDTTAPIVLLLNGGGAAVVLASDRRNGLVLVEDMAGDDGDATATPVDENQLSRLWNGDAILLRSPVKTEIEDEAFSIGWLARLVRQESAILRGILVASFTMSVLAILPPLAVMAVIDRVVEHGSLPTLATVSLLIAIGLLYETILGFARRQMTLVVGARVDAKLNLHLFRRILGLPLDYFEREQAGVIVHHAMQVNKVRDFLTGKLLSTALDLMTLVVLLPVLFLIEPTLTWLVIAGGCLISLIIFVFLGPMRRAVTKWIHAETQKSTVLVEAIQGIRTIKSLALEPQQRLVWDRRTAEATRLKLASGHLSNWPQTLVTPIDSFMQRGVLLLGAYFAIQPEPTVAAGSLIAFMMLSGRVAQPLASLAKLMEDLEEVRTAVVLSGEVLNRKPETRDPGAGLRPSLRGAISFRKVAFTYAGAETKALDDVSFEVPAGTTLGLVGRSGSGKSTVTRLLQGISRDYRGLVRIDGTDLRDINLQHLRSNLGVVLQDNFLFRGSIRENILAGRANLTLQDAVRAARLAGAEEFIERLPGGYETHIEEGSPNLSGGQRQRLAIARALVHDPRFLILDEATSALDPESEAVVNANLAKIAAGRTMVIVSHRLSSVADCDNILVMDNGRVDDIAPHAVLLERCAIYRQLWFQQTRQDLPAANPAESESSPPRAAQMLALEPVAA